MLHIPEKAARAKCEAAAVDSSSWAAEEFGNFGERAVGGAAAAIDQMFCVLAHCAAALRIAQQFDPGYPGVFRTLHLDGSVRSDEARGNLRKILHGRPEDRNLPERRGFQNIVPARRH